jgi:hypothetical protein
MVEMGHVATPELLTEADPRTTPLLRKETVPVGLPDVAVTVAVSVVDCPTVIGFADTWSAVFVAVAAAALTVSVIVEEAEAAKVLLPVYCAVSV